MGTYSGPPSASDGLVLYLDAANSASYSGSGNTFYNLVNASIGGSIVGYASTPIDNTQIKSLTFDGSNDFISVGSLGSFYTQGTISFWMKSLDITANYRNPFATNYNGLNVNVLRFEQGEGVGALKCWFGDPSGTITSLSYSSISANTWYNVVLTWNQSTTTVTGYMNGVLDFNNSSWVRWPTSFVNVGIGLGYNSRYFLGNIGQVSIYNRALSASEIFQNYNASKKRYYPEENIVTDGLVLNIDPSKPSSYAGLGNTIYDLSGSGIHGALINTPSFSGLNGGQINMPGSSKYIDLGQNFNFTSQNFSISYWIYLDSFTTNQAGQGPIPFFKGDYQQMGYYSQIDSNGSFGFATNQGGAIQTSSTLAGIVTTSTWYHLSYVRNGTSVRLYSNGVDSTSAVASHNNPSGSNQTFKINYYKPDYLITSQMRISQFLIHNRALSAVEVQQNYNATKGRFGY
jgi:hypothetical protein